MLLFQGRIALVELPQIFDLGLDGLAVLHLLLAQHGVFDEAQVGDQLLLQILREEFAVDLLVDFPQHPAALPRLNQRRSHSAGQTAVTAQHLVAEGVDGAKLRQRLSLLVAGRCKQPFIPPAHILRARFGKGDGQNGGRVDAVAENHVGNPCHHHRRLARSRHRQQQHRTVDGLHRRLLLFGKTDAKLLLQIVKDLLLAVHPTLPLV